MKAHVVKDVLGIVNRVKRASVGFRNQSDIISKDALYVPAGDVVMIITIIYIKMSTFKSIMTP